MRVQFPGSSARARSVTGSTGILLERCVAIAERLEVSESPARDRLCVFAREKLKSPAESCLATMQMLSKARCLANAPASK